jgi:hypothetical protein
MAITSTTLTYAIGSSDTVFALGSTTNVVVPVSTTGAGSYLYVGAELMQVVSIPAGGMVKVVRAVQGSNSAAHSATAPVLIGGSADFQNFTPQLAAFQVKDVNRFGGFFNPVAAAASITAPGSQFHITGTTAINIINPPGGTVNFVEGTISVIADGAFTWASSAVQYGIATSGSATVGTRVTFTYDANTQLWYPGQATSSTTAGAATAAAATLVAPSTLFHVTGTTALNIITPPANFSSNAITIIANAVLTWTQSSTVTNGIAQSGTVTSAGETVTFTYDPATALWYPSRVT